MYFILQLLIKELTQKTIRKIKDTTNSNFSDSIQILHSVYDIYYDNSKSKYMYDRSDIKKFNDIINTIMILINDNNIVLPNIYHTLKTTLKDNYSNNGYIEYDLYIYFISILTVLQISKDISIINSEVFKREYLK